MWTDLFLAIGFLSLWIHLNILYTSLSFSLTHSINSAYSAALIYAIICFISLHPYLSLFSQFLHINYSLLILIKPFFAFLSSLVCSSFLSLSLSPQKHLMIYASISLSFLVLFSLTISQFLVVYTHKHTHTKLLEKSSRVPNSFFEIFFLQMFLFWFFCLICHKLP